MSRTLRNSKIVLLFTLMSAWLLSGCFSGSGSAGNSAGGSPVRQVQPMEVEGLLRNDFAVLIDVREEHEVKQGLAAKAQWIPLGKIEADAPEWKEFLARTPADKELVFYCRSGRRSGIAAEKARAAGRKAANMGGFADWQKAGLPVRPAP